MAVAAPLVRCPKCNGLMPPDALHCIRCGFQSPPKTKQEIGDSSDVSQATISAVASTQRVSGTTSARKAEKPESKGWRAFLAAYLAWFALIAIMRPEVYSSGDEVIGTAFGGFFLAIVFRYLFLWSRSAWQAFRKLKDWIAGYDARNVQRINWTRVFAVILTSNVFFFTSCTGGFIASFVSLEKMTGQYMEQGAIPSENIRIVAAIPNPNKQGDVKYEQVSLRELEKFKTANPAYSFLLPLGSGRVPIHSETSVTYEVQPAGDGKVLVESRYHQTMGGLIIARYEATDKSVRRIFTNDVQWMAAFFLGALPAMVLYLVGRVLRYFVTASDRRRSLAQTT